MYVKIVWAICYLLKYTAITEIFQMFWFFPKNENERKPCKNARKKLT